MQRFRRIPLLFIILGPLALMGCQPMVGNDPPPLMAVSSQSTPVVQHRTSTPQATATATLTRTPVPSATWEQEASQPAATATPDNAWAKKAGLGAFAPAEEDRAGIEGRAMAEGYVVLYGDTSRAERSLDGFMQAYPGLEAEVYALDGEDIYLRLLADIDMGRPAADVYLVADAPRTLELLQKGYLVNYVPPELRAVLPEDAQEPLLTHHWSALMMAYNPKVGPQPDIDSWWDLTRPEWRGKVVLPDPMIDEQMLYLLATMVEHADAMLAAYQQEFAQNLELDKDCPNAGYQWIKDIYANDPRWMVGDAEVAGTIGDLEGGAGWLGVCNTEQLAKVDLDDLALDPLAAVAPMAGLKWRTYLAIVAYSEHPDAAKLVARWLMGDGSGTQGYSAWLEAGFYPTRTDLKDPRGTKPRQALEPSLWEPNPVFIAEQLQAVRDFVAAQGGKAISDE